MNYLKLFLSSACIHIYWFSIVLTIFIAVPLSHARVSRVTVSVDGMSCPFCAFGVEKRLKKVDGAGSVDVDLKTGTATLSAAEGQTIDVDRVPDAIKTAGFTPGTIRMAVTGTLTINDSQTFLLQVDGSKQTILLAPVKEDMKERITTLAKSNTRVEVNGIYQPRSDKMAALSPESIEGVSK